MPDSLEHGQLDFPIANDLKILMFRTFSFHELNHLKKTIAQGGLTFGWATVHPDVSEPSRGQERRPRRGLECQLRGGNGF